ncbi:hypothetical protein BU23DRAFT_225461 [Bimuria novae-zelandiae CBS 107.79]|uniref:Uncharacterized protein n=1 Tax=Bimuria novae-zelandiae CBS 107.79 TaxID=1447943 RepID=A0A6A5VRZ6_9PLEO|nr:hypothetical protein BU23DRAFT_225461 [Bimuria novae-zelandiae CBS 107.79]
MSSIKPLRQEPWAVEISRRRTRRTGGSGSLFAALLLISWPLRCPRDWGAYVHPSRPDCSAMFGIAYAIERCFWRLRNARLLHTQTRTAARYACEPVPYFAQSQAVASSRKQSQCQCKRTFVSVRWPPAPGTGGEGLRYLVLINTAGLLASAIVVVARADLPPEASMEIVAV